MSRLVPRKTVPTCPAKIRDQAAYSDSRPQRSTPLRSVAPLISLGSGRLPCAEHLEQLGTILLRPLDFPNAPMCGGDLRAWTIRRLSNPETPGEKCWYLDCDGDALPPRRQARVLGGVALESRQLFPRERPYPCPEKSSTNTDHPKPLLSLGVTWSSCIALFASSQR